MTNRAPFPYDDSSRGAWFQLYRPAAAALERALDAQLERAATRAFRDSFLIGAGLALLALVTVLVPRRRRTG